MKRLQLQDRILQFLVVAGQATVRPRDRDNSRHIRFRECLQGADTDVQIVEEEDGGPGRSAGQWFWLREGASSRAVLYPLYRRALLDGEAGDNSRPAVIQDFKPHPPPCTPMHPPPLPKPHPSAIVQLSPQIEATNKE